MSSLPKTFKAAVFEAADQPLTFKDLPLHPPKDGEILIKVEACGVCHADLDIQAGHMNGFPIIPGHEFIGVVAAVSDHEKTWKVGDRAGGAWHGGHCGTCTQCRQGDFQFCKEEQVNGVSRDGGYGEYAYLRSEAAVPIPKDIDAADYGPMLCAGVTVFNCIRKAGIRQGDIIAVQGLGGLGHLALQFYSKLGYKTVALSTSASKEKFARDLGAHVYIDTSKKDVTEALQELGGAAAVVVTAPNPTIMKPLQHGLAPRGKLIILPPVGDIPVDTVSMVLKGQSVMGWPSGHAIDSAETITFAQNHGVKCMVEKFKFEDANKALDHLKGGHPRFRCVLVM